MEKYRITDEGSLKKWCTAVNTPTNNKIMSDLQDIFAYSDIKDIKRIFLDLPQNEKELTIFCVQKAMGSNPMFSLMKSWARQQANICINEFLESSRTQEQELNNRYNAITQKERDFEKEKTDLNTMVLKLTDWFNRTLANLETERETSSALYIKNREQAEEISDLYEIIEKNKEFEARIKTLLNK